MQFKFRTKIFLSISIILLLALAGVYFAATPVIQQQVSRVIDDQISRVYNTLDKVQYHAIDAQVTKGAMLSGRRDLEGALLTYYESFKFDPSEFQQAEDNEPITQEMLVQSAQATVRDVVLTMLRRFDNVLDMDFLLLLDVNGNILFDQGLPIHTNNASELPIWDLTGAQENNAPFIYGDELYHGVLEPIYYVQEETGTGSNDILGYIATGIKLDSNFIRETVSIESIQQESSGFGDIYITFISHSGRGLATNIKTNRNDNFGDVMMKAFMDSLPQASTNGENGQTELSFDFLGEEMTGKYWNLTNPAGETIAYQLLVTSKTEAESAFLNDLNLSILLIAAVTLLIGFAIGYFTSKSVTRPVDILVDAANELSNGNLEYKIEYASKDEMGFLSQTLEQMRVSILNRIQQIQSLQDELIQKEKLASIGSVASAINHEIRNQLSFGMAAELIRQQYPKDQQVQTYTQMILDARDYILRMLDDIRNFARSNQNVEYTRETKPLKDTLKRTVAFCRFDNELKHVELDEQYEDVGEIECDHQRIGQVIINLIRNGGHAMEKAGILHIRLKKENRMAVIEVEDHGCGIPEENREKIWESFFSTKGDKGLGLGLDICKKIIEDHGGQIYCESEVEKGTTFFVKLPQKTG